MNDDDQLLTHRLRAHVTRLAEEIGERNVFNSEALRRAAAYIEAEWGALGYGVDRLEYDVSGIRCANLIAIREGSTRGKEILLLGAHYDSVVGCPGANDNASGVAALLEISRMFQALEPELTVHFVAFVNEEPPFFGTGQQGSVVYAQAARRRGDDIRLMASLETIGCYSSEPGSQRYPPLFRFFYPNRGNFIGIVSDFRSRTAMRRLAAAFRAHSDFPLQTVSTFRFVPGVAWSDHDSFWRHGYPAVLAVRSSPIFFYCGYSGRPGRSSVPALTITTPRSAFFERDQLGSTKLRPGSKEWPYCLHWWFGARC